ncbi:MAG TPA: hypothetical protein PLX66_00465 [Bacilli bacterium]|nr:hypothetical protein [Bacilli bacterium]
MVKIPTISFAKYFLATIKEINKKLANSEGLTPKEIAELRKNKKTLLNNISLAAHTRVMQATDQEIEAERPKFITETKAEIARIKQKIKELEAQINNGLSDNEILDFVNETENSELGKQIGLLEIKLAHKTMLLELLNTVSTEKLRDILAEEYQKRLYELIEDAEIKTVVLPRKQDEIEHSKNLYERVAVNGIDPGNIIFSAISSDEEKRKEILPIANRYNQIRKEKEELLKIKISPSEIKELFLNSFPFLKRLPDEKQDKILKQFYLWAEIDVENDLASEIRIKIENFIKKIESINKVHPYPGWSDCIFMNGMLSPNLFIERGLKPFIAEEQFTDLKTSFKKIEEMKDSFFSFLMKGKIKRTEHRYLKHIYSIYQDIIERQNRFRKESMVEDFETKLEGLGFNSGDYDDFIHYIDDIAAIDEKTHPLPDFYENFCKAYNQKSSKAWEQIDQIDLEIDKIRTKISEKFGVEISDKGADRDTFFPDPQNGESFTNEDIDNSEKAHREELIALDIIEKAKKQALIELSSEETPALISK